tara:strand:+ start:259 stop:510 length:252 start_codon:yes stop_codon:yes gene_type:complete
MFQGLPDDQELAWEIYQNSFGPTLQDREVTDLLMHKSLMFAGRKKFADAVFFSGTPILGKQQLYIYIEEKKMHSIYKKILDKI